MAFQQIVKNISNNISNNVVEATEPKKFPRYGCLKALDIPKVDQSHLLTIYLKRETKFEIVRLPLQDNIGSVGVKSIWENIAKSGIIDLIEHFAGEAKGLASAAAGGGILGYGSSKLAEYGGKAADFALKAHNAQAFSSTYSQLYWNGSSFDPISHDFVLVAIDDAKEDVVEPLKKLMSWGAPQTSKTAFGTNYTGFQKATSWVGNKFGEAVQKVNGFLAQDPGYFIKSPPYVSVKIGNLLTLHRCAITDISVTFANTLDDDGYPVSAKGRVSFKPTIPPHVGVINGMFTSR